MLYVSDANRVACTFDLANAQSKHTLVEGIEMSIDFKSVTFRQDGHSYKFTWECVESSPDSDLWQITIQAGNTKPVVKQLHFSDTRAEVYEDGEFSMYLDVPLELVP